MERTRRALQHRTLSGAVLKDLCVRSNLQGARRVAIHAAALAASSLLVWSTLGTPWLIGAMLVQGLVIVCLFAPMHECVHYTAFEDRRLNDICAFVAGGALLYVASYYRQFHVLHHRFTQDPARDPELLTAPPPANRATFLLRASGLPFFYLRLTQLASFAVGRFPGLDFLGRAGHRQIVRSTWLLLAVIGLAVALSLAKGSAAILWFWIVPLILATPLLRLYLVCEHTGCEQSDDAFANTRTTLTWWPVRLLMWNMPFHAEHHLYPAIPFHALPAAHRLLRNHLKVTAQGYLPTLRLLYADCARTPA